MEQKFNCDAGGEGQSRTILSSNVRPLELNSQNVKCPQTIEMSRKEIPKNKSCKMDCPSNSRLPCKRIEPHDQDASFIEQLRDENGSGDPGNTSIKDVCHRDTAQANKMSCKMVAACQLDCCQITDAGCGHNNNERSVKLQKREIPPAAINRSSSSTYNAYSASKSHTASIDSESFGCCKCFRSGQIQSKRIDKIDKTTARKYRKNLANYAAFRSKFKDSSALARSAQRERRLFDSMAVVSPNYDNCVSISVNGEDVKNNSPQQRQVPVIMGKKLSRANSKQLNSRMLQETSYSCALTSIHPQSKETLAEQTNKNDASLAANHGNNGGHYAKPVSSQTRFCKLIESRKKAAKMLIVIVIMFGLCYLPVHFLNTLR